MASEYLLRGGAICQMNFGAGQGTSAREAIDVALVFSVREISVHHGSRRPRVPPILDTYA